MSFLAFEKLNVEVGDTVILYINIKTLYVQVIKEGEVFQTKFGAVKHDNLIGSKYGHRYNCTKGYVHILRATPELWTLALPHRTQILYFNDISLITSQLELRPGSIVVEAGTGSGSLTHSLTRTVAPHGHVHTFDFHESRVADARAEFKSHGLADVVTINQRDVCNDGFPVNLNMVADALFLDLPHPWEAIGHAKKTLKRMSRICCFSPCIEQVQRTTAALRENKFIEIFTYETVNRPYEAKQIEMNIVDTAKKEWVERPVRDKTAVPDNQGNGGDQAMETSESVVEQAKVVSEISGKPTVTVAKKNYTSVHPIVEIAGHTGFLTFATNFL